MGSRVGSRVLTSLSRPLFSSEPGFRAENFLGVLIFVCLFVFCVVVVFPTTG